MFVLVFLLVVVLLFAHRLETAVSNQINNCFVWSPVTNSACERKGSPNLGHGAWYVSKLAYERTSTRTTQGTRPMSDNIL